MIWEFRKRIAVFLVAASAISNALGIVSAIGPGISMSRYSSERTTSLASQNLLSIVYAITSIVVNVALTLLTAHSRAYMVDLSTRILYPILQIVDIVVLATMTPKLSFDPYPLVVLSAVRDKNLFYYLSLPDADDFLQGVAPTLIIVRVRLEKDNESSQRVTGIPSFDIRSGLREGATSSEEQTQNLRMVRDVESGGERGGNNEINETVEAPSTSMPRVICASNATTSGTSSVVDNYEPMQTLKLRGLGFLVALAKYRKYFSTSFPPAPHRWRGKPVVSSKLFPTSSRVVFRPFLGRFPNSSGCT
ncbi:hypothetical protein VNI00_010947 [Paramarasmius palmivorus]|uniref:Uncharacterized protein n=1 Tax=Paramarasmius palmivorus TaxID=297713 RepID=A0AAW0CEV1_9AGAR